MAPVAELATAATFVLALAVQTVAVIVWVVRLTTRIDTTIGTLASSTVVTALAGRVDSLQRQVDNDRAGRAAFAEMQKDVAVLKAGLARLQEQLDVIGRDLRAMAGARSR